MALKPSLLVGNRNRRSPPEADLQAKLDAMPDGSWTRLVGEASRW